MEPGVFAPPAGFSFFVNLGLLTDGLDVPISPIGRAVELCSYA